MLDVIIDTLIDSVKLLPFLFFTYLAMEYIEHKTTAKTKRMIQNSGKAVPFAGAIVGAVPQCGFSAAASNLYAGRVITLGTLIAIYLSTSDEMLPVFLSEKVPASTILTIILWKIVIGMAAGFIIDFVIRKAPASLSAMSPAALSSLRPVTAAATSPTNRLILSGITTPHSSNPSWVPSLSKSSAVSSPRWAS